MYTKPDPRYDGRCMNCKRTTDPMWLSRLTGFVYCDDHRFTVATWPDLVKVV
ncbi:hypothetical protein [Jiangella rhizosphaerae]|uniref:hypothetical protein n=1 Tax=Jiangella rhizosphaerae TaxID=2293569 RepID=UPI001314FAEB|nr:hypothetical protein [Jiangella rhizosphaerae]